MRHTTPGTHDTYAAPAKIDSVCRSCANGVYFVDLHPVEMSRHKQSVFGFLASLLPQCHVNVNPMSFETKYTATLWHWHWLGIKRVQESRLKEDEVFAARSRLSSPKISPEPDHNTQDNSLASLASVGQPWGRIRTNCEQLLFGSYLSVLGCTHLAFSPFVLRSVCCRPLFGPYVFGQRPLWLWCIRRLSVSILVQSRVEETFQGMRYYTP